MKKYWIFIIGILAMTVFSGCDKDKDNEDTKYYEQEYPSTAIVLKQAVTDYDGNIYDAVQIGDQIWMASNLRVTHYNDGTEIPSEWRITPKSGNLMSENVVLMPPIYGYFYRYSASDSNKLCPNGWHLPNGQEWEELEDYIDNNYAFYGPGTVSAEEHYGGVRALTADHDWEACSSPYTPGYHSSDNNATGFSALPTGLSYRWGETNCGRETWFWGRGANYSVGISYDNTSYTGVSITQIEGMKCAVRCIKD